MYLAVFTYSTYLFLNLVFLLLLSSSLARSLGLLSIGSVTLCRVLSASTSRSTAIRVATTHVDDAVSEIYIISWFHWSSSRLLQTRPVKK